MRILVQRQSESDDGIFGRMTVESFSEISLENKDLCIDAGIYKVLFRDSPEFNRKVPWIQVPGRTWVEIHPANKPCQLKGCITCGKVKDGDAVDSSTEEFDALMEIIENETDLEIEVRDICNAPSAEESEDTEQSESKSSASSTGWINVLTAILNLIFEKLTKK